MLRFSLLLFVNWVCDWLYLVILNGAQPNTLAFFPLLFVRRNQILTHTGLLLANINILHNSNNSSNSNVKFLPWTRRYDP